MKKMILVVDDEPISLHLVRNHLQEAGYLVETAENGLEAWEILQKNPDRFSVVVADRIMPKLHGLDLLGRMRKAVNLKNIPLIMLTGVADKEEMTEAIKAGVFDFLYKPVEKDLLMSVLRRIMLP